jgi:hypothetical protein
LRSHEEDEKEIMDYKIGNGRFELLDQNLRFSFIFTGIALLGKHD